MHAKPPLLLDKPEHVFKKKYLRAHQEHNAGAYQRGQKKHCAPESPPRYGGCASFSFQHLEEGPRHDPACPRRCSAWSSHPRDKSRTRPPGHTRQGGPNYLAYEFERCWSSDKKALRIGVVERTWFPYTRQEKYAGRILIHFSWVLGRKVFRDPRAPSIGGAIL